MELHTSWINVQYIKSIYLYGYIFNMHIILQIISHKE